MKNLTIENLEELAIGCTVLGSGGGGDPTYAYMMARYELEKQGLISLISIEDLQPDDLIVPIGFMGAPLAELEKPPSGREFINLFKVLEKQIGKKIRAVMPFEIGGGNAFTPLVVGAQFGVPVLDADMMGRAFPEFKMSSCHLAGIPQSTAYVADSLGNVASIYSKFGHPLEKIGVRISLSMGSICAFSLYPITGSQASTCTIHKTISKAINIGKVHNEAKKNGQSPLTALLNLCKGVCIGSGKIIDIERVITDGLMLGHVKIQDEYNKIELAFKNEYLIAKAQNKIVATTPDIIIIIEKETGMPIASESLQFGLKVDLAVLPAPTIWTKPAGLALVGPRHFGYDVDYQPINKSNKNS